MATTTTFTVSASADDGQVTKSTSSATIPTSGWSSPSTSGSNIIVGAQENYDNWPNYAKHYLGFFRFQNIMTSSGLNQGLLLCPPEITQAIQIFKVLGLSQTQDLDYVWIFGSVFPTPESQGQVNLVPLST